MRISGLVRVSYSTLMRFEYEPTPPTDLRRRAIAYLALVAYGYDPTEFGLSENDLPRWITPEHLARLRPGTVADSVRRATGVYRKTAALAA